MNYIRDKNTIFKIVLIYSISKNIYLFFGDDKRFKIHNSFSLLSSTHRVLLLNLKIKKKIYKRLLNII